MKKTQKLSGEEALAELLKGIDTDLAPSAEIGDIAPCDRKTLTLHDPAITLKDEDGAEIKVRAVVKLPQTLVRAKKSTEAARAWWNTNQGMMMKADAERWKAYIEGAKDFWWLRVKMSLPIEMYALEGRPEMLGLHYQEATGEIWMMEGEVDDLISSKLKQALSEGKLGGIKINGSDAPPEMMEGLLKAFKAWKKDRD